MPAYVDFDSFGRATMLVAQVFRASELFSMLKRRAHIPPGCAGVVWGDGGAARLLRDGSWLESDGAIEVMIIRTAPIELSYVLTGLTSRDGFSFTANVDMTVCAVPERAEMVSLRGALVDSRDRADIGRVRLFCEETVRTTAALFAKERDAAELASAETWDAFDPLLAEHFTPVAFQSGLALGKAIRASFASAAHAEAQRTVQAERVRRERLEADARLRSAAVEARKAHLSQLESLLEKVRSMSGQSPGTGVAELIRSFDPTHRGELYHGLLATARPDRPTEAVLVVAGDELLWLDPAALDRPLRRVSLTSEAGGLRSVRVQTEADRRTVLVGAGRGMHVLHGDGPPQTFIYEPPTPVRGGFNSAVQVGDRLFATHSEIGVVEWSPTTPTGVRRWESDVPTTVRSVRDIHVDETGRLWFTVDDRVIGRDPSDAPKSIEWRAPATVTALHVCDGRAVAGLKDGRLVSWLVGAPDGMETLRGPTGRAVESLARIAGGGVERLVVADGHVHVDVRVIGDSHSAEYRASQPIKWAFAADDWLVGVNEGRDQVIVWRPESPEEPAAWVSIGRLCGRSIQDVALLPARTEPATTT